MFSIHRASTGPSNMYHFLRASVAMAPRRMSVERIPSVLKDGRKAGLGPVYFCWNSWQGFHHKKQQSQNLSYFSSCSSPADELYKGPPQSFLYWDSQPSLSGTMTTFSHQELDFMSSNYKMSSFLLTSLSSLNSKEASQVSSTCHRQFICSLQVPLFFLPPNVKGRLRIATLLMVFQLGNYRLGGWIHGKEPDSTLFITEVPHLQLYLNPGGAGANEQESRHKGGCLLTGRT